MATGRWTRDGDHEIGSLGSICRRSDCVNDVDTWERKLTLYDLSSKAIYATDVLLATVDFSKGTVRPFHNNELLVWMAIKGRPR